MSEDAPLVHSQSLPQKKNYSAIKRHPKEQYSPTEEIAIYQASVFVEDAICYRSIHHKISPRALKVYRFYHHWSVQLLVTLTIFVLLVLAFFEFPTSINLSADFRYNKSTPHISQPHCGATESVELVCLLLLLANLFVQLYVLGFRRFVGQKWLLLYTLIILVSFVDLAVSLSLCMKFGQGSLGSTIRIRRFVRPLFLVISSSVIKKFLKAVVRTMKQILSILVLLVLHIFIFAMIGQLVYARPLPTVPSSGIINDSNVTSISDFGHVKLDTDNYSTFVHLEGMEYFDSVEDSLSSLLVYLTTSNNPDIMTPIYQYNRLSFIYFFLFLSIGLYLILNVLTAAIYTEFRGYLEQSMCGSFLRRQVALKAAFIVLDKESQGNGAGKQMIFNVLDGVKRLQRKAPEVYVQLWTVNADSEYLSWNSFKNIFNRIIRDKKVPRVNVAEFYSPVRIIYLIQKLVRHGCFSYLSIAVMLVHVGIITVEMEVDYVKVIRHCNSMLAYTNLVFCVYYVAEQMLKIVGLSNLKYGFSTPARRCCMCAYLRSLDHAFEFVITMLVILTEMVILAKYGLLSSTPQPGSYATFIRIMNLLVVLRLLGIISMVAYIWRVFSMMVEILKNLQPFAAVIIVIYYLYALLGMEIFGRNYHLDNVTSVRNNICGTYEQQQYFAYNFHDFASSLVLLWNLMVVNNWYIFKEAFVYATNSKWTQLYFISWWLLSVVVTLNLFISLVIEIFVTQWEGKKGKEPLDTHQDDRLSRNRIEAEGMQEDIDNFPQVSDSNDVHMMLRRSFKEPTERELQLEIDRHADLL